MTTTPLTALTAVCQALGDETRLRILGLLADGEVCVCDIHQALSLTQPKVSRHLARLRRAGLVIARRDGLWMHYRLAPITDPVVAAVVGAVSHALTHVGTVRADAARVEREPDGRASAPAAPAARSCCSGGGR